MSGMRFETSASMKMGQHQKLAPRMIQSMEILQLAQAELEERIEQELENNPTLELTELTPELAEDRASLREELLAERAELRHEAELLERPMSIDDSGSEDFARLDRFEADNPDFGGNTYDADRGSAEDGDFATRRLEFDDRHESHYAPGRLAGERDAKSDAMMAAPARSEPLGELLRRQWSLVEVRPELRPLGELLIDALDDDGYLRTPLDEVLRRAAQSVRDGSHPALAADLGRPPTTEDLEQALQAVQLMLEPAGVAARTPRECLLLQLDAMLESLGDHQGLEHDDEHVVHNARLIVADHLDDLLRNRLPRVSERSGLSLTEIRASLELMKRLSLAPGRRLSSETARPIVPDAIVEYDDDTDRYICYLNDRRTPNLRINREYALLSRDRSMPAKDRAFLRTNLSNASWLIAAIEQRQNTLLRVLQIVLDEQRDYFDLGPDALRPLPMTQVAEQLGIHVATVSRAVSGKHIDTPRGIVALRGFFSGGLATDSGEDMSYDAVRAAVKEVVETEDKSSPLSDEAIAAALQEQGIEIARRTVAKYRGQLSIPSARMRRQFVGA